MAKPISERSLYLALFTGASALVATYFAARHAEWEPVRRVVLAVGFLLLVAVVYAADWYVHRRARN